MDAFPPSLSEPPREVPPTAPTEAQDRQGSLRPLWAGVAVGLGLLAIGGAVAAGWRFAPAPDSRAILLSEQHRAERDHTEGRQAMDEGRPEAAITAFRRALVRNPQLVHVRRDLAFALQAAGRTEEARAVWADLVAENPDDAQAAEALMRLSPPSLVPAAPPSLPPEHPRPTHHDP